MSQAKILSVSLDQRKKSINSLLDVTLLTPEYAVLLMLSTLIVVAGLLIDSASAIIGGMVVAPLLSPILAMAMGFALADFRLLRKSIKTLVISTGIIITIASVITLFSGMTVFSGEILERSSVSFGHFLIAVCAGILAAMSHVRPNIASSFTGIAVSVALLPPIVVTGIGIAKLNWELTSGSLMLFLLNLLGIIFPATIVFSMMGFYSARNHAKQVLAKEEKEVAKEWKDLEKTAKQ